MPAVRAQRLEAVTLLCGNAEFLHESQDPITSTAQWLLLQVVINRAMPIATFGFFVELTDALFKYFILNVVSTGCTALPGIVAAALHIEAFTKLFDCKLRAIVLYKLVLHSSSALK